MKTVKTAAMIAAKRPGGLKMIKQIWIAQCDVCGLIETARMVRGRW